MFLSESKIHLLSQYRLLFTFLAVSFTFFSFCQFDISYEKLGDLILGTSLKDVEKLSGRTFEIPVDEIEAKFETTIKDMPTK